MKGFVFGLVATAIAFAILAWVLPQVEFTGGIPELLVLALVFGVVNGLVKPAVKLLSFPINAMTLGLFGLVINAALLLGVAWLVNERFDVGFTVGGFPASPLTADTVVAAAIASVVLSVISAVVGLLVRD